MTFNSFDVSNFSEGINQVDGDSLGELLAYAYMCSESCPYYKMDMKDNFEVPIRDLWADVFRCAYDRWSSCFDPDTLEALNQELADREFITVIAALNLGKWWKVWGFVA
jgi:hypothetical protein